MESSQNAQQPNNHQSPSNSSSQKRPSFTQGDQDFFGFLKNEEKFKGSRPFFSKNGLSQDIIQVTEAEPDVALEVFYALYNTLWPQIEKQPGPLKDAWTNFIGGLSSRGVLWSPEKLMSHPQEVKETFRKKEGEKQVFLHLDAVVGLILDLKTNLADHPGQIVDKDEMMASLELVRKFYLEFRSKVKSLLTMILQNKDALANYHALESLLEPKAVMMGDIFALHWAYRIPRKKAKKMLSLNEWKDHVQNYSNEGATHRVAALHEKNEASDPLVYFKANGEPFIQPEKEFMLYSLYRHLQIPVPETALLILTNVFVEDPEYYFAVQASEAVTGDLALKVCQKKNTILDQEAFASQLIGALLTNPSDGSFKNFKYNRRYKTLISIDNDMVFEPELTGKSEKIVNVKSILYLLPQIEQNIPKSTNTFFKTLDPNLTIFSWLKDLSEKNKEYNLLFTRLTFQKTRCIYQSLLNERELIPLATCLKTKVLVDPKPDDINCGIFSPQILVSKDQLANLTEKLQIIAKVCDENQSASAQVLFKNISPILEKCYQKLRLEFTAPEKALDVLWNESANSSFLKSLLSPEEESNLVNNKITLGENLTPETFFKELKDQLISGKIPPLEKFIRCQITRKESDLLDLGQTLKELRLLIQEGLTDTRSPRDIVDFWYKVSKMTESDDRLRKETAFLLLNLPGQELKWLFTLEKYFKRAESDVAGASSVATTDTFQIKRYLTLTRSEKSYLFDNQGKIKKNDSPIGRYVACFPQENPAFYLKQSPKFPGYEFASALFMRMIGVTRLPYQDLIILNSKYPVLVTQKVDGDPVFEIWQKPEAFNKLDPFHTYLLIISAMLLNPGKEDNFILSPDGEDQYLIPIGNDHYFLPSTFQEGGSVWSPWTVNAALQTKSLLFCLDEMKKPIPDKVKQHILGINFDELLQSWLKELIQVDKRYHHFVDKTQREAFLKNGTVLEIPFYDKFIQHLDWKVNKIQDLLRTPSQKPSELTPFSLLKAVEPFAARCYQDSFQKGSTVQSRFKIATNWLHSDTNGSRMSIVNTHSIMKIINISEKNLQSDATYRKMLPSETLKALEQLIEDRDKKRKKEQELLCEIVDNNEGSFWTTFTGNTVEKSLKDFFANPKEGLILKGSKWIISNTLGNWLAQTPEKGAKIKFLSLPNSPLLSNDTLRTLVEGCPNLEYLNVSGCPKLGEIVTKREEWPSLTRLEARDCLNLKKLTSWSPMKVLRIGTHQKIEILVEKNILDAFAISTPTNQLDFLLAKRENSFEIQPPENAVSLVRFLQNALLRDEIFDRYFKSPTITIGSHSILSQEDLGVFITSIDIRELYTNQEKLKKMANLPKLKSLQLPKFNHKGTSLFEDLVQGDWPGVAHLNLSENEINDEGLAILSQGKWPQLEILDLSSKEVTKKGLLNFVLSGNWPNLKEITFSETSLPLKDFANGLLPKNRDLLGELDLSSLGITQSEIKLIVERSNWPNLKHFNLSHNEITDEGLAILSNGNWPLLEFLNLEKTQITSARMEVVVKTVKWPSLKHLILSENEITDEGFATLSGANWPLLEKINLIGTRVTNKGLLSFYSNASWPKLKEINFPPCIDLNIASFLHQKKSSQVERLGFDNGDITPHEIGLIVNKYQFQGLKYLNLSNNEIFDNQFLVLAFGDWPLLEQLYLKNTRITSQSIETLVKKMKFANLKKLDISENAILDEGLEILTEGKWVLFQHLVYYDTKVTLEGNINFLKKLQWPNLLHLEHSLTESFYNFNENPEEWSLPGTVLAIAPIRYKTESMLVTVLDANWLNLKKIYLSIRHNGLNESIMILPRDKLGQLEHLKLSVCPSLIQPRLLPSHIKILDFSNSTSFSDEKKLESLLSANWPLLEHLDLSKTNMTTNNIGILTRKSPQWPSLKKLCVSHNKICDEGVELLLSGKWPLLESLNLRNISMTTKGINSLILIPNLKALDISENEICEKGMRILSSGQWPLLESLSLCKISMTIEGIRILGTFSVWPNLKILDVSDNSICGTGLRFLCGAWISLESLTIKSIDLTAEEIKNVNNLSELSKMKKLDISNNSISDKGLEILASKKWFSLLESLNLSKISMTVEGIKTLIKTSEWPNLKILDVSENSICDQGLKWLSSGKWPGLENLNLSKISMTAEGTKSLVRFSECRNLRILDVSDNSIQDIGMTTLSAREWSSLEKMNLRNTELTADGIKHLVSPSKWPSLKTIQRFYSSMREKGFEVLSSKNSLSFENLTLKNIYNIAGTEIENMTKTSNWPNLKILNISENMVNPLTAARLIGGRPHRKC